MRLFRQAVFILLLFIIAFVAISSAKTVCSTCGGGSAAQQDVLNKEWAEFLGNAPVKDESNLSLNQSHLSIQTNSDLPSERKESNRSSSFANVLVPISRFEDKGIIVDISPNSSEYIPGSINIPYTRFVSQGGVLKTVSEMAQLLGDAGISQNDQVRLYGECQPCGGGPSAKTYVYWIMKYLGHQNVELLDGGIEDWVAAKLPTETNPHVLPKKTYVPTLNPKLLATYEYLRSGSSQIVDARTPGEFSAGSIPGAINVPYDNVLDGKEIKEEGSLKKLFAELNKNKPVVVYTNTGVKASMVWFALTLLGYDARLYSWQDWKANQPNLNFTLKEAKAQPNPAKTGDVVMLTVVFDKTNENITEVENKATNISNKTVLTIKGCATCGFGSPQGFADISKSEGVVQIGSASKAPRNMPDNNFKVTAAITSPAGAEVGKVIMKRVSGDEFTGIWNANVASGVYRVQIVTSVGEATKTFPDALEIEVKGTNKYKNLGE